MLRGLDGRSWRTATWAAPFAIQVVLGLVIGIAWLLGKHSDLHAFVQFAIATAATFLLVAAISIALFTRGSWRAQGIAISIVGSFIVAAIGATAYGLSIIGW